MTLGLYVARGRMLHVFGDASPLNTDFSMTPSSSVVRSAVILKANRLYGDTLRQLTCRLFPLARVDLTSSIADASFLLTHRAVDLLLIGTQTLPDGDTLDFVSERLRQRPALRVLVIAGHCENRVLAGLRSLPIHGIFDAATEEPGEFMVALRAVAQGIPYWSSTILERLRTAQAAPNSAFRVLTPSEQRVLSVIGDGSDDVEAAQQLGLSPGTITSVRRNLHRKLGVQHRGELVRIAAQNGFVRFTCHGVERPGFNMLSAACQPRATRRLALAV